MKCEKLAVSLPSAPRYQLPQGVCPGEASVEWVTLRNQLIKPNCWANSSSRSTAVGRDVFIRAEVSPVARFSKEWVCVRPPSAVLGAEILLACALGSMRSWWGTGMRRRHLAHPALKGTAIHPSWGISDFCLQQAEIDTTKKRPLMQTGLSSQQLFPWCLCSSLQDE